MIIRWLLQKRILGIKWWWWIRNDDEEDDVCYVIAVHPAVPLIALMAHGMSALAYSLHPLSSSWKIKITTFQFVNNWWRLILIERSRDATLLLPFCPHPMRRAIPFNPFTLFFSLVLSVLSFQPLFDLLPFSSCFFMCFCCFYNSAFSVQEAPLLSTTDIN